MRRVAIALVCLVLPWLLASVPAGADVYGPIELVSSGTPPGGVREQADTASYPAMAGDGRYVAFVGSFSGRQGIWRRDLTTGVVEEVAAGVATMPSISSDGRYVSFTTTERLVPAEDRNNSPDVYVRDMQIPCTGEDGSCQACAETAEAGECPFKLVSAVNGTNEGTAYRYTGPKEIYSPEQEERDFGALAQGRSAISADGRYVAFVTTAESELLGGPTPPLEVFVRDLHTKETKLVSAEYEPAAGRPANGEDIPVPSASGGGEVFGAVFPGGAETPIFGDPWVGASISADGSTVAWMGQQIGKQARLLTGEQNSQPASDPQLAEPLWRRISEGPAAPTRRITGGSDPSSPGCEASGERVLPQNPSPLDPCAGPFEFYNEPPGSGLWKGTQENFVPQLSGDGTTVAFITGARELAAGERQFPDAESTDDLYLANMASGLTRVQSLQRLTEIGGGGGSQELIEKAGPVVDVALSPDGSQLAFTTQRTIFPLGSPSLVSAEAAEPGMLELFGVDLLDDTLTRVTHGFEGDEQRSEQTHRPTLPGTDPYSQSDGALSPSFSEDGNAISFASTADNLAYGDGNGASDAFVVHRENFAPQTVVQYISPAPANPVVQPDWQLTATASPNADGSVQVYAEVPGAGTLAVAASAKVLVQASAGTSRHTAHRASRKVTAKLATRVIASAKASSQESSEGLLPLKLTLAPSFRSLSSRKGGISATLRLTFSAPGEPVLRANLVVNFTRTLRRAVKKAVRRSSRRAGARSSRKGVR